MKKLSYFLRRYFPLKELDILQWGSYFPQWTLNIGDTMFLYNNNNPSIKMTTYIFVLLDQIDIHFYKDLYYVLFPFFYKNFFKTVKA